MQTSPGQLSGASALVTVDGWNVSVTPTTGPGIAVAPNIDADVEHWSVTGLPFQTVGLR
jgi:hypothetical protein